MMEVDQMHIISGHEGCKGGLIWHLKSGGVVRDSAVAHWLDDKAQDSAP